MKSASKMIAACCCGLTMWLAGACSPPQRPGLAAQHFMLITLAGVRADHMSAYQYARPTTFSDVSLTARKAGRAFCIDDLAADGVLFSQAFAPTTDPVASLATLMTGVSVRHTGMLSEDARLASETTTLAECLAAAGFVTAGFATLPGGVAQPGPAPGSGRGIGRGFERFAGTARDEETLRAAIAWVTAHDYGDGGRTFLWIHLAGASFPFEAVGSFDRDHPDGYDALYAEPDYNGLADGSAAFRAAAGALDWRDRDRIVASYDGEIAKVNFLIEYLLDFFTYHTAPDDTWRKTLFMLAGSSGLELFRRADEWGEPNTLHDTSLRVPLLMRHPDSLTGRRVFEQPIDLQDVYATVVDWFDIEADVPAAGRSLLALTDSYVELDFETRPVFAQLAGSEQYSARDRDWRLILQRDGHDERRQLFHAKVDPLGLEDVGAQFPDRADELEAQLRSWLGESSGEDPSGQRRPGSAGE